MNKQMAEHLLALIRETNHASLKDCIAILLDHEIARICQVDKNNTDCD